MVRAGGGLREGTSPDPTGRYWGGHRTPGETASVLTRPGGVTTLHRPHPLGLPPYGGGVGLEAPTKDTDTSGPSVTTPYGVPVSPPEPRPSPPLEVVGPGVQGVDEEP